MMGYVLAARLTIAEVSSTTPARLTVSLPCERPPRLEVDGVAGGGEEHRAAPAARAQARGECARRVVEVGAQRLQRLAEGGDEGLVAQHLRPHCPSGLIPGVELVQPDPQALGGVGDGSPARDVRPGVQGREMR